MCVCVCARLWMCVLHVCAVNVCLSVLYVCVPVNVVCVYVCMCVLHVYAAHVCYVFCRCVHL